MTAVSKPRVYGLAAISCVCVDGFARRSGIQVDLDVAPDVGRLPQEAETVFGGGLHIGSAKRATTVRAGILLSGAVV